MIEAKNIKRTKYRTTNWKAYNSALKARGSLTMWLDQSMQSSSSLAMGERVGVRTFDGQVVELHVRVALLNRVSQIGRPQTVPVAVVT